MTQRGRRFTILMLAVMCVASMGAIAFAKMDVSGYTQARYNFYDDSMYKADEFDLRRVRVKFKGPINEQGTVATVQVDLSKLDDTGSGEVGLKDAIIEQPLSDEWRARLGFSSVLFGYEVPHSSSHRLPFERSQAARKLFPGERDTGLYLIRKPTGEGQPEFVVAFSDGMADWEDDEQHAFIARAQWSFGNESVAGVSYMNATRTQGDEDFDQDVFGAHVRWNGPSGVGMQAEYYDGKLLDIDVDGWYGQLEYAFPASSWTGYYRYDTFDDGNPTHDEYKRSTVGAAYQLDKSQRITLELEDLENESGVEATNWGLQWQFKY